MRGFLRIVTTGVALATFAGTASAGVLTIDQFDYTGALTDNGWVAHSGAGNKVIMADGVVATLEQSSGSGEDVNLAFAAQMATDKTYAAFDLNLPAADNADIVNVDGNGMYFFHLKDAAFSFRARTGVVAPTGGGDYGLAINADSSGLGGGATWATDLSFDTTYRVVISWDAGTGESQLWVDPVVEGDTSIAHTGGSTGTLIDSVALRQGSDYIGMQLIDNVIVGESFDDVVEKPSVGLFVIDQFDYTGALTDNGWVAHSGAGNKVVMADGSVATLEQSSGSGEDVNLAFAAQGETDKTYAAFDLNLPAADNADIVNVDSNGMYFFHLKDEGFSFRARTGVVAPASCESDALCDGDVNGSGDVDPLDSGAILARFGLDPCANDGENCVYDVNCDGAIDPLDSGYVLARFGLCNPPVNCTICAGGGDYGLAINADSSGLGGGATWADNLSFDTTYRVVVSWDAGTGESQLWLDPENEASPSISHTGSSTGTLIASVALRQGSDYTGMQEIDNVIAGDSFDAVLEKPTTPITINELRIAQSGADDDQYFELCGGADASLDGLTYLVIGDPGDNDPGSGVIEAVVDLTGSTIPADGLFFAAEDTFTLNGATPDLITTLNFEGSDNVTHLLVRDFTGADGDDLDIDDDGVLDSEPWSAIVDCIGLVESVDSGDLLYCDTTIGPDGSFVPAHGYRCEDCSGDWLVGLFSPLDFDTPGELNACAPTGACCSPEGECTEITEADCLDAGNEYQGDDTDCDTTECVAVPGACCVAGECSDLTFQECADAQGNFEGSGTSCADKGVDCSIPCSTVAEVRALAVDVKVNLCGVTITSTTDLVGGGVKNFQLQDDTGALAVFSGDAEIDALLAVADEDDEIDLVAVTNFFCGLSEVSEPFAITLVVDEAGAKDPVAITVADMQDGSATAEALESKVVVLEPVFFLDGDGVATFSGGVNYIVEIPADAPIHQATVRISTGDLDMVGTIIPTGLVTITGILGQFDCSDPFDSGYQLAPRSLADIVE
ncbi:MAG: hypothetical protein IID37_13620 [Planctomycetes bacterium]|nr:hypothetical protein [Planctomycetota bacterium]